MWVLIAVSMLVWLLLAGWQLRRMQIRYDRLSDELIVYTEASERVAQTLDRFMLAGVAPGTPQPSRRHLLASARAQLAAGVPVGTLSAQLGLCRDEQGLLTALSRREGFRQPNGS